MTEQPSPLTWQVVTYWLSPGGSEYVSTTAFDSAEGAIKAARCMGETLGERIDGQLLKAIRLAGNLERLCRPEPTDGSPPT